MKVNVLMTAYNHENFIAQAVESVLMQKTDFDYCLIIGEDCSTDQTRRIVAEYANKYPDKIRPILREKNIGLMPNFIDLLGICNSSEYMAWLEGDDFWTDPEKLQKQVDFLDSHPDYAISAHNANVMMSGKIAKTYCRPNHPEIIDLEHLLTYGSGGPTCSLVIRNTAIKNLPDWFGKIRAGDWAIQVVAAQTGKMKYFKESMGTYRRHGKGALYNQKKEAKSLGKTDFCLPAKYSLEIIDIFEEHFKHRYDKLLKIQKTYWYSLYITAYLEIGEIGAAKKYYHKILSSCLSWKYWRYPLIPMKRFIKFFILLLPTFLIKILLSLRYPNIQ